MGHLQIKKLTKKAKTWCLNKYNGGRVILYSPLEYV